MTGKLEIDDLPALAQAGPGATVRTDQVRAELLAHAPEGLRPGRPAWLGLRIDHAPGWHVGRGRAPGAGARRSSQCGPRTAQHVAPGDSGQRGHATAADGGLERTGALLKPTRARVPGATMSRGAWHALLTPWW